MGEGQRACKGPLTLRPLRPCRGFVGPGRTGHVVSPFEGFDSPDMCIGSAESVGGGDSFASGLAYGLLAGEGLATAVEYGAAHGALAMTTPGDTTMVTKAEVLKLAAGGGARVDR